MYNKLQYISQGSDAREQITNINMALDAGCQWIQLRFKGCPINELIPVATRVRKICGQYSAKLIINDFPHVASESDADGVHLGLNDMPVEVARKIAGQGKIIGGTANSVNDVMQRVKEQCDYVGVGPYRFTPTKEKLSPVLGISGYLAITEALRMHGISIPIIAIGGILLDDVDALMNTGVHGIAVSALITLQSDKKRLIEQLNQKLYATV